MPELPEVETARRTVDQVLVGRKILKVTAMKDDLVFDEQPARKFKAAIEGAKVLGTDRRGKYFWIKLDRSLAFYKREKLRLKPSFWIKKFLLVSATGLPMRCKFVERSRGSITCEKNIKRDQIRSQSRCRSPEIPSLLALSRSLEQGQKERSSDSERPKNYL